MIERINESFWLSSYCVKYSINDMKFVYFCFLAEYPYITSFNSGRRIAVRNFYKL